MSIIGSNVLAGASGQAGEAAYEIEQSLRFDGSSYLYRTNSGTGNRDTYTFSFWVKRAALGGDHTIWSADGEANSQSTSGHDIRFVNNWAYAGDDELIFASYIRPLRATTGVQRDPSAWAHYVIAVDTTQATQADRIKMWVNGDSTITDAINTAYWPAQNQDTSPNRSGDPVEIGRNTHNSSYRNYGNFYLAEFHYVDGTAYDETSFGEYDDNGVWRAIEVSGLSYGTNGWYMKFDPSATNGIGHDHSGNGNNFTASGFTTSGTGTDVMDDTPTNNWCVMNPNDRGNSNTTLSNGNLSFAATSPWDRGVKGTFAVSSGKWYWEYTHGTISAGSQPGADLGITKYTSLIVGGPQGGATSTDSYILAAHDGDLHNGSYTGSSYGSSANSGDVISIALDLDNGKIWWAKNGTWFNSGNPASGTNAGYTGLSGTFFPLWYWGISPGTGGVNAALGFNFGQRDFAYTPPTGFKTLSTKNLPAPDIADGSDYFNTILWAGDNANPRTLTGVGFQPDWVWLKDRTQSTNHRLVDAVRGAGNTLKSNNTSSETSSEVAGTITAFTSDGFTVEGTSTVEGVNLSGDNFVAWNWLAGGSGSSNTNGSITSTVSANPTAGFSIVSFNSGATGAKTVGHGLGVAPQLIITKDRDNATNWTTYHASATTATDKYLNLNGTAGVQTASGIWGSTLPTSTVFGFGSGTASAPSADCIAYCFAEVEGYSKFGSYTGNGSTDGPFVHTGFAVRWLMWKKSSSTSNWVIWDTERHPYNVADSVLFPNGSAAEETNAAYNYDLLSNGFKVRTGSGTINDSGATYIFAAFASSPFGGSGVSPATAR